MGGISGIGVIGNVYITIAGNYCGGNNLNKFINIGGLYNINRFYSTNIFSYNNSKGG